MSTLTATLKVRRGTKSSLPLTAALGELLFATDTQEFFIGTDTGVVQIGITPQMLDRLDSINRKLTLLLLALTELKHESTSGRNSLLEKYLTDFLSDEELK